MGNGEVGLTPLVVVVVVVLLFVVLFFFWGLDATSQAKLLAFATGSARAPINGLKGTCLVVLGLLQSIH